MIQRSRVNTGVFWVVPQTVDAANGNPYAKEAHDAEYHIADPGQGSEFSGQQGQSELTRAKVECATCHNGWVTNCVGCHVDINVGDQQRNKIDGTPGNLTVSKSAGENEIWLSNTHNKGHINFQLLTLLRAPFTMGVGPNTEKGRLSLFRSSMQATVSVSDTKRRSAARQPRLHDVPAGRRQRRSHQHRHLGCRDEHHDGAYRAAERGARLRAVPLAGRHAGPHEERAHHGAVVRRRYRLDHLPR